MARQTPSVPPLAVTMGEPAGIGPEITLKAWLGRASASITPFFVIADPEHLAREAERLGSAVPVRRIDDPTNTASVWNDGLPVLDVGCRVAATPGEGNTANAEAVIASVRKATELSLSGDAAAVVTNPIHKKLLYSAGFSFPGHTEFVANLCGTDDPVMMLASPDLRVVPVTVHRPLLDAITALDAGMIEHAARITNDALRRDFGIGSPRLAVAGLNPHAGEDGSLGTEEQTIVTPAVETLRADGLEVAGPVPPDALFTPRHRETFDAAICMYHDQALIPIKALDFDRAVNTTLGLPIIRTSPDHGTALDIAGRGIADPSSLISAIALATRMSNARRSAGPPA